MDEYIKRELAIEALSRGEGCGNVCRRAIERIVAADVAPVRHGRWVPFHSEAAGDIQYCSVCEIGFDAKTVYCPHCGAKMDLEG